MSNTEENHSSGVSVTNKKAKSVGKQTKRRSKVWNDFTIENTLLGPRAKCIHCGKDLSAKSESGTKSLFRHLETCGKRSDKEASRVLSASSEGEVRYNSFNQDESQKLFTKLVIHGRFPFHLVRNPALIEWARSLQPMYTPLDQASIENDCFAYYNHEKTKLHNELKDLTSKICFTCKIWTSGLLSYFSLTAQFIDDDFNLIRRMIGFKRIASSYTHVDLRDVRRRCYDDWDIDEKRVFSLTADDRVIKFFEQIDYRRDPSFVYVECCSQILTAMVQDCMKTIHDALESIRKVVVSTLTTSGRRDIFNQFVGSMEISPKRHLILDVETRWDSTFNMLRDALAYKDVFDIYARSYLINDFPSGYCLSHDDWTMVEATVKYMESFHDAFVALSNCNSATANLYFQEIWEIRDVLFAESLAGDGILDVGQSSHDLQEKFQSYWDKCLKILLVASILDPRSKLIFLEYCYSKAYEEAECKRRIVEIRKWLQTIYSMYASGISNQCSDVENETVSTENVEIACSNTNLGKRKITEGFYNYTKQAKHLRNSELDAYLKEDVVRDRNLNVLSWWKSNTSRYPVLSRMARDFLAIPVVAVPSELAFSLADTGAVDQFHNALSPEMVEALMCGKDWIRASYNDDIGSSSSNTC